MTRFRSHGTLLKMSDGLTTPTFSTVAQVRDIRGPNISRGVDANADHDMAGGIDKIADGLYDGGQITFDIAWDPTGATHNGTTGLRAALKAGTLKDFKIVLPNTAATELSFSGYVTEMTPSMPANKGMLTCSVTIEVSGDHTETT